MKRMILVVVCACIVSIVEIANIVAIVDNALNVSIAVIVIVAKIA